jgi:amino acid transporter
VCGKKWGQMLTWLVAINLFFAGIIGVSVTSRVTYALARDAVLPFHEHLKYIHPKLKLPINAMLFTLFMNFLYLLLTTDGKEGYTIFTAIGDMCTLGLQVSNLTARLITVTSGRKLIYHPFVVVVWISHLIQIDWWSKVATFIILAWPNVHPLQYYLSDLVIR